MCKSFALFSLIALVGGFLSVSGAIAAPQGWTPTPYSERGGIAYHASAGDEDAVVLVLSAQEISKMSVKPVADLIAEFEADPEEALFFALSVLTVDVDESQPLSKSASGAPLLVGLGITENGERRFAIAAQGEGADRTVIAFIATDENYDAQGGADFLDQAWLEKGAPQQTVIAAKPEPRVEIKTAKLRTYKAPLSYNDVSVWPQDGLWRRLAPGDPASPRHITASMSKENSISHAAALRGFAEYAGVEITGSTKLEQLESWTGYDGRDVRILLTETRLAGGDGVLFLFLVRGKGKDRMSAFAVEMADETYRNWSGVARMLVIRGVIKSVDVYPSKRRKQIASAPLRQQMALYEATLEKLYKVLTLNLMRTQAQTLMMMQELNYDLLFGNDISTPGLAD